MGKAAVTEMRASVNVPKGQESQKHSSAPNAAGMLLPSAADYLGQWLAILADHYPGELTPMAVIGYRIGLKGLSPRELDIAFSESLQKNQTSFRPTAGEIRGRLREARMELRAAEVRALPEAPLSPEEAKQVLEEIHLRRASFPPSDIEIAKVAIKHAREELQIVRQETGPEYVIELSEELLQKRERLKQQALEWANLAGKKDVAETANPADTDTRLRDAAPPELQGNVSAEASR